MQTLKTAAIVVLLMTVMYGAYVSLTTPPDPLPADVEDMLVASEEESLAIDVGLPASLGEMEFNDPVSFPEPSPVNNSASTGATQQSGSFPSDASFPAAPSEESPLTGFDDESAVTASLSDTPANASAAANSYPMTSSTFDLPDPNDVAADLNTSDSNATREYPVTSDTFQLPDPNQVVGQLNTRRSEQPSELALASGTSEATPDAIDFAPTGAPASGIQMNAGLSNAFRVADKQYAEDKRKEALATLSLFYNSPSMTGEERSALLARLDPLAREVIYSTRHLLEQPYRVGQKETLMDVATRYEVPWKLLANINEISDPVTVLPGTELKVVRGPFRAEVNLTLKELTLFLGDMYAGRFPVGIGNDPAPKPGTFTVQDKQTSRTFYNAAGNPIPAGSRENPYGNVWLDLGGQLSIHGSPSTAQPTDKGCISLAGDYADDLYGILSQGSSVTIRR